ncbi:MAG: hypothetical protein HUJ11_01080, partial [Arenibacter algicola]|nr:hypothetical protein [Arenibacter algicola]
MFSASKANSIVYELIADVSSAVENINAIEIVVEQPQENNFLESSRINTNEEVAIDVTSSPMMFATIINGANEQ